MKRTSSGNTIWTEEKVVQFYKSGTQIGRGVYGKVMANDSIDPSVVVKYSESVRNCAEFKTEFEIASHIHEKMDELGFSDQHTDVVKVIAEVTGITTLESGKTMCALVMEKISRPNLEYGRENGMAYHAYFGFEPDENMKFKGRGNYIGLNNIRKIFTDVPTSDLIRSMAHLVAFLHYGANVTATDMEYIIGYSPDDTKPRIYAIDFNLVRKIDDMSINDVGDLEWSLSQEKYFPVSEDEENYNIFKDEYLNVANKYDKLRFAEEVIDAYE